MEITPTRAAAHAAELARIHDTLRERIERLLDGEDDPADLRTHCLAFCDAVTAHHTAEDDGAFPALLRAEPALAPVLEDLRRDHEQIAAVLREVVRLAAEDDPPREALEGLAAVLESHFRFEERRLATALDLLGPGQDAERLFGPLPH